jgi:hypothetical protein
MKSDLNKLLTALLVVAKDNLKQQDGFAPFAALVRSDSDTLSFAQSEKASDDPQKDMGSIERWLCEQVRTGAYRAVGVCAQVEITLHSPTRTVQAIFAVLEHTSGESFEVFVPFEKNKSYKYQKRVVRERAPTMFVT